MKTYYLTSFWKFYSLLSGSILLWFILGALVYLGSHFDFVFILSMLGLADLTFAIYSAPPAHLVVSEKGLVWNGPGFSLSTNWEHATRISHRLYGFSVQEGLAVTKLRVRINKTGIGYLPTPWHVPPVRPFIPLSCFVNDWRDSELGQQIKYYAPHLFEQSLPERTSQRLDRG